MKIKQTIDLHPFPVPDFVTIVSAPGKREDGIFPNKLSRIELKNLDDDALKALCDQWVKDVYAKAGKDQPDPNRYTDNYR